MEQLARYRGSQQSRFHALAMEIGLSFKSVLFCQVWSANQGPQDQRDPVVLRVEAQSALTQANESIKIYANLSSLCGIRAQAMDLIGDCRIKGATRVIEELEHANPRQHPRNLLPGESIPACSALFLPIYDPVDPFSRHQLTGSMVPSAVLEVLVCKTAQMLHNNSDLLNSVCAVMDKYKFGVSADTTAFREWARSLGSPKALSPGTQTPQNPTQNPTPRNSMSRTSTYCILNSDSDTEDASHGAVMFNCKGQASRLSKGGALSQPRAFMGLFSVTG